MHPITPRIAPTRLSLSLVLLLAIPLALTPPAQGASFTINSTSDQVDATPGDGICASVSGLCTLRAAVMEANVLPGTDLIDLPSGIYLLSIAGANEDEARTGDLDITGGLSIVGAGMESTGIDAAGLLDRVVHVHPGAILNLQGLSLVNADIGSGANGAGLRNDYGTVLIEESSFQWNRAHNGAGLMNVGDMVLRDSLVWNNTGTDTGAGIRNDLNLEIDGSTIGNNRAQSGPGGGVENHGSLIIRNTTLTGNRASNRAAAIYNGYGPFSTGASLVVNNSTIFGNLVETDAGEFADTGGIYNESISSVEVGNTILAGNAVSGLYSNCAGIITSSGYNLFGAIDGCSISGDTTGNLIAVNDDPGLGPLTTNPNHTASHPLLPDSPAINAGNPAPVGSSETACEIVDQRGFARPMGPVCDIGAYESEYGLQGTPSWTPTASAAPPDSPTATETQSPTPTQTYSLTPVTTPTATSTQRPSPTPLPEPVFADDFESGDLLEWSSAQTDQGDLSGTTAAAIGGAFGLQAVLDDNRSIFVVGDAPSAETAYRARFYFDPNGISMASGNTHVLLLARDSAAAAAFRVEFRSFQGDYQLRAVAPLDSTPAYATPWLPVSDAAHLLEVSWWSATGEQVWDGGLLFSIDGEPLAGDNGLDNDTHRVDSIRLGAVSGIDGGTRGTYFFDSFYSTRGLPIGPDPDVSLPSPTPLPDVIFADGFESADVSAWSAVKSDGDLLVTGAAALDGAVGLEAVIDGTTPLYVTDWSPVAEREYRARFLFDTNGLAMLDGRSHYIFQALMGSSQVVARVELRYKGGSYQVRYGVSDEVERWRNTAWWPISDGPHAVEVLWKASTQIPVDGVLSLWIDRVEIESQGSIYNLNQQVDLVRLGAVTGIDSGTLGSMYFDAFESRREAHIGPP